MSEHEEKNNSSSPFIIALENLDAVNWFFGHQYGLWRTGFNGIESMDYSQIHAAMQLEQRDDAATLFAKLLHIERGYLTALREQRINH